MPTSSDFLNQGVSKSNVVGGPARIMIAPITVSYPTLISEVLDLSTYQPQAGWLDLGHTSEPFQSTDGFDAVQWVSQQQGVINTQVGNWNRSITVTLMEGLREAVMDLAHSAGARETNADGDKVTYYWDRSDTTPYRMVAVHLAESKLAGSNIIMDVFPNCKRSGADSQMAWDRGNPQTHSLEVTPFPDDDVPNKANWYRIEQD